MPHDDPGLEQRLSRFEAQLDRFSLALHQWQHSQSQASTESPGDLDERMRSLEPDSPGEDEPWWEPEESQDEGAEEEDSPTDEAPR